MHIQWKCEVTVSPKCSNIKDWITVKQIACSVCVKKCVLVILTIFLQNCIWLYASHTQSHIHFRVPCLLLTKLGSRGAGGAVPGSLCYRKGTLVAWVVSSYSPGMVDADYCLSKAKAICAWWRATSYEWWPCCAEHSGSKGENLAKQSPILWCECRA